eukprot:NODE_795_length_4189_cov_0.531785.p3 type:complete len:172 gc:universal NODE_795_length_4189_cov_0.531785:2150-2665(+)
MTIAHIKSNIPILDDLYDRFLPSDVVLVIGSSLSGKTSFCKLFTHQVDANHVLWCSSIQRTSHIYVDSVSDVIHLLKSVPNPLDFNIVVIDNITHLLDAEPNLKVKDVLLLLLVQITRFKNAVCFITSLREYKVRFASIVFRLYNSKTDLSIKMTHSYRHITPNMAVLTKI